MVWRHRQLVKDRVWHNAFCYWLFVKIRPYGNTQRVEHPLWPKSKLHAFTECRVKLSQVDTEQIQGFTFSPSKRACVCKTGITQWSAINSTFGLHNGQKGRKSSFSLLWNIVFLTREEGGSWESKDSGFLLGSWVGLEASRMKRGADGGEVNASTLPCNRHEGLLTRLPCYWLLVAGILSLRLTDGGGFSWYEEERKDERRIGAKFFHHSFEGEVEGEEGVWSVGSRWWSELGPSTCLSILCLKW